MDENKELRQLNVEFRKNENGTIEGCAIPFNTWSPVRQGFREMILPEAVEGVIEQSDIFMRYNHDESKGFLARCKNGKGSLKIDVRDDGVHFSFKPKKDNLSQYIVERLEDRDISEMSFAFTVESDQWTKEEDGTYSRVIGKFYRLYDLSVVDNSFYGIENAVTCKRFEEIQEQERKAIEEAQKKADEEKREQEEAEKKQAIKAAHDKIVEEYGKYMMK